MLILLLFALPFPIPHLAVFGVISYFLYKRIFTRPSIAPKPSIHKKDFKQDTVYLYQFGRVKNVACTSPFGLKIEVFCRANNIPYEICVKRRARSRNGTLPFIELNGEHIADSDLILERLRKQFHIEELSEEQETLATALTRLADNHLFHVLLRYKLDSDECWLNVIARIGLPEGLNQYLLPIMKAVFERRYYYKSTSAIGDFEPHELNEILQRDLKAIQSSLGDERFLFGNKVTAVDATVFSHLASVYYQGKTHVSDVLEEDFPRILEYLQRVREEIFPTDFVI